jgi:hypothetical protein
MMKTFMIFALTGLLAMALSVSSIAAGTNPSAVGTPPAATENLKNSTGVGALAVQPQGPQAPAVQTPGNQPPVKRVPGALNGKSTGKRWLHFTKDGKAVYTSVK